MKWYIDKLRQHETSECECYRITNFGDPGGSQYCLWERVNMDVNLATGRKRKPYMRLNLDIYCRLLTMGTRKHVKTFLGAGNE